MAVRLPVKLPPVACNILQRTVDVSHKGGLPLDEGVLKMVDGGEVVAVVAPALGIVFKKG